MEYVVNVTDSLIIAILVLGLGTFINSKVRLLSDYNIPAAVSGGIVVSFAVAVVFWVGDLKITFDMAMRDILLLVFFSTIGLSAKLSRLKEGGKALGIMACLAGLFLILQNLVGVAIARMFGANPFYGLLAGSISFSGGHGTSITWGQLAEQGGLPGAVELGLACATLGLIGGGLIGGPVAARLMKKFNLSGPVATEGAKPGTADAGSENIPVTLHGMIGTILLLAVCVSAGDLVNRFLTTGGYTVPGFLTAMGVGVLLTNLLDAVGRDYNKHAVGLVGDISLQLFLGLSLMSMQLASLVSAAGPILIVTTAQVATMALFAYFVVFRVMGKDYDACVISVGYIGQGLGATPIGIANMHALTAKFGPSTKAFLVIPLIGAFFVDILNALVIQLYLALPMFQ